MVSREEKNIRVAEAFWWGVHAGELDCINEYVMKNHIHYSQFGMACGNAQLYQESVDFFSMFAALDNTITHCVAAGNLVCFNTIRQMKHIGTFRGLEPTGNVATNRAALAFEIHRNQITNFSIVEDTEAFITQLVGPEEAQQALKRPMLSDTPQQNIKQLCALFRDKGIKITPQQLKCLSLWFAHYSYKEIGETLGLSHSTVDSYLSTVRAACRTSTRRQLFELLVESGLLDALLMCKRIILNN